MSQQEGQIKYSLWCLIVGDGSYGGGVQNKIALQNFGNAALRFSF